MPEEAPDLEKQSCDSAKSESETNIVGITKATVAIEKGMGYGFLQSSFAFLPLCGSADYAPASGESTGIQRENAVAAVSLFCAVDACPKICDLHLR